MKTLASLLAVSLVLAQVPAFGAATTGRDGTRPIAWHGVETAHAVIGSADEFAEVLSKRELPLDDGELAQAAAGSAAFLRDNPGQIAVLWEASQRRLKLVSSTGKSTIVFDAQHTDKINALGALLSDAKNPEDAAGVLRQFFDLAARGSVPSVLVEGDTNTLRQGPGLRSPDPLDESRSSPPAPHPIVAMVPNLVTGLNLASGFGALFYAAHGMIFPAAGLILLANVFDAMDGRVARALRVPSELGTELDSLADVVSFGVAPAMLIHQAALASLGWAGFVIAASFAFAGAYRLARFNLMALRPTAAGKSSDSFTGMPIPAGAGVLVSTALALSFLPAATAPWLAASVTAIAALAMVSTLPYPAFKKGGMKALLVPAVLSLTAAIVLFALGFTALVPAAVFGGYLLTGPIRRLFF